MTAHHSPLADQTTCDHLIGSLRLIWHVRRRRRAYQRAVAVPTDALDDLWRAYEAFEFGGPNKTLAKRLVDEHRPVYQLVRFARMLCRRHTVKLSSSQHPLACCPRCSLVALQALRMVRLLCARVFPGNSAVDSRR